MVIYYSWFFRNWKHVPWIFRWFLVPVNLKATASSVSLGQSYIYGFIYYYLFVSYVTERFPNILTTVISHCLHPESLVPLLRRLCRTTIKKPHKFS